jgi:hypothetical protein
MLFLETEPYSQDLSFLCCFLVEVCCSTLQVEFYTYYLSVISLISSLPWDVVHYQPLISASFLSGFQVVPDGASKDGIY